MVLWISFTFLFSVVHCHDGHDEDHDDEIKAFSPEGGCDDGITGADVDLPDDCRDPSTWDTCPTWTCQHLTPWDYIQIGPGAGATNSTLLVNPPREPHGGHKCINTNTTHLYPNSRYPNGIPTNGYHRPKWPVYGEYRWLPPLRYIHSLEHGAVVFMYHPCTPPPLVEKFRKLATTCLWKHVFFRFKGDLGREWPMAMVVYGHMMKINDINDGNIGDLREWIRQYAKVGAEGEGRIFGDGIYNLTIINKAELVTVIEDSEICPMPDGGASTAPVNIGDILSQGEIAHEEHGDEEDNMVYGLPIEESVSPTQAPLPPVQPEMPQASVAQAIPTVKLTTTATTVALVAPVQSETIPAPVEDNPLLIPTQASIPASVDVISAAVQAIVSKTEVLQPTPVPLIPSTTISTTPTVTSTPPTEYPIFPFETTSYVYEVDDYLDDNYFSDPFADEANRDSDIGNTSEPIWAFLSLSILVVGLGVAVYKSQLCKRPAKNKYQNPESWSDDEASMSVGTLIRGFRRKSKDHNEQSYSLLKTRDEEDL